MKYGAGGCAHRWCRALLLSSIEPENTVFALIYCDRLLYYTIYTPNFAKTYLPYVKVGINTSTTNPFFTVCSQREASHSQTQIFQKGKNSNLGLIVLQSQQTSCGGSGSDSRGLKGAGTEPADFTPRVKFIDCRQSHLHPYLWKHRRPFCREAQFWWRRVQNGERERETWVGGMAGSDGEREIKKRFYCVSLMVFSESKWATDEKMEDVQRQYERENKIGKKYAIRHNKQSSALGELGESISACYKTMYVCAWWQWVCIVGIQFHISSRSTYKKGHSFQSMKWC